MIHRTRFERFLVLATAVALPALSLRAGTHEAPLTIMPFQTATFVSDQKAAREINNYAEFSTRLLYWNDTPRERILLGGQVIKGTLGPFIDEWRGLATQPGAAATAARRKVAGAFRELHAPRLARLVVGEQVTFSGPQRADVIAGEAAQVPCVLENQRAQEVTVTFRGDGGAAPLTLGPGESRGVFLPATGTPPMLEVEISGTTYRAPVPVMVHRPAHLEVSVIDDRGQPIAARVYATAADTKAYAPNGVVHRILSGEYGQPFGGTPYFYTEGTFALTVPSGDVALEVVKGFEYEPVELRVTAEPGETVRREIRLKRRSWVKAGGWYSGDSHVHGNLFAQALVQPADVRKVARAEDLNVVNLLPCNDPRTTIITDRQHFTGAPHPESDAETILYYSEEMRNDIYGHVGFLGLKQFVEPAYVGWPNSPYPYDHPDNFPQCLAAKAQGAAVTYVHPSLPSAFPVDIALGAADTIDVMSQYREDLSTQWWYKLLNCGFRCPASAGPDSFLNVPLHLMAGSCRVYVNVDGEFTYDRWLAGFKRGRSFVTNGPLVRFTVNGALPGDELRSDSALTVSVAGFAECNTPIDSLEIIVNGEVVKRVAAGGSTHRLEINEQVTIASSGWIALRVRGPAHRLVTIDREAFAHSSPIYVQIAGRPVASRDAADFFIAQIDALIAKMDGRAKFARPEQREEIVARFRQAQEVYRRIGATAR